MQFFLTILAFLPILIESSEDTNWALYQAKNFQKQFVNLVEEKEFHELSRLIAEDFQLIEDGYFYRTYNKAEYLKMLKEHPRAYFSNGEILSAKRVGFSDEVQYEVESVFGRNQTVVFRTVQEKIPPQLVRYDYY